jgi:D-methionine transport system substrate-binding protein
MKAVFDFSRLQTALTGFNRLAPLLVAAIILSSCGVRPDKQARRDSRTILVGVTQKPTYPDLINHAIKPQLEKKGYRIELLRLDDQHVFNQTLVDGFVDINIGQHEAALNFEKANNPEWKISPLIAVPSAHMGIFSDKYKVKTVDELKRALQPGDIVAMPDDVTNLARSLIFLEKLELLGLKSGVDKFAASEHDIDRNPYRLEFKTVKAEQIPRILDGIAVGVIYGDDADLLGILDRAIIREVDESDLFLNIFVIQDADRDEPWVKDFRDAVVSEEFKTAVEDKAYRFHRYYRPSWYREKWGIANEWGK